MIVKINYNPINVDKNISLCRPTNMNIFFFFLVKMLRFIINFKNFWQNYIGDKNQRIEMQLNKTLTKLYTDRYNRHYSRTEDRNKIGTTRLPQKGGPQWIRESEPSRNWRTRLTALCDKAQPRTACVWPPNPLPTCTNSKVRDQ